MNTASQDLPRHLGVLRDKLQHPTDDEQAVYFKLLDERIVRNSAGGS